MTGDSCWRLRVRHPPSWNVIEEKHGDGRLHLAGRVGDIVLELYPLPVDAGPVDTTTGLGFTVPDLDAAVTRLGVVVSGPQMTEWGRKAVARDPDGRKVELVRG